MSRQLCISTGEWAIFRKAAISFAEALHRAWQTAKTRPVNDAAVEAAKAAAGVTEECRTWADWHRSGYEVTHGSKALFQAVLIWASKGDDARYTASFFGASQVHPIEA